MTANEQAADYFNCGCPGRLRAAAEDAGWVLHEDGWWRHPISGEPPFADADVSKKHAGIALRRPSILAKAPKVIAKDLGEKFKDFAERMGLPSVRA